MAKLKSFVLMWILLMLSWLALNLSLHLHVIIFGVLVVSTIAYIFAQKTTVYDHIQFNHKFFIGSIIYLYIFIRELIKANIDVMKRVLSPKLNINPGIVEIKVNLKSDLAKLMLANSITLTPGTLTMDIQGNSFFIHWIDVASADIEEATNAISATFEKCLEVYDG